MVVPGVPSRNSGECVIGNSRAVLVCLSSLTSGVTFLLSSDLSSHSFLSFGIFSPLIQPHLLLCFFSFLGVLSTWIAWVLGDRLVRCANDDDWCTFGFVSKVVACIWTRGSNGASCGGRGVLMFWFMFVADLRFLTLTSRDSPFPYLSFLYSCHFLFHFREALVRFGTATACSLRVCVVVTRSRRDSEPCVCLQDNHDSASWLAGWLHSAPQAYYAMVRDQSFVLTSFFCDFTVISISAQGISSITCTVLWR